MFGGFFDKVLSLSGSYNHYKSECSRLEDKCSLLEEENHLLRDDLKNLISCLSDKQDRLYSLYVENDLVEGSDKILDALIGLQDYVGNGFKDNRELLESLDDSLLRVEKSSSYTNVKLDSKFDENKRFILDEVIGRLDE